jgi:DNA segregation ATPase FtsK/SpoIIIE-like protein
MEESILKDIQAGCSERVEAIKEKLLAVLADHKIKTTDIQAVSGPSVTTYKVYPAKGVSCAKIKRLQDEIELSLNAGGVRVVALPDSVGVEVANEHPSIVPLKPLLDSDEFKNSEASLPVAVGRDTEGRPCIIDLAEAPHILMAGATKQGKTTAVHSLILSLLRSRMPEEVRFAFIDPKGCELKAYKSLSSNYILAASDAANEKVITTQSVSPRVITGIIKASFPTRMAFRVFSKAESKIILDTPGAERLIGSGDMLLERGGEITRVQGAYAGREEIDDIVGILKSEKR